VSRVPRALLDKLAEALAEVIAAAMEPPPKAAEEPPPDKLLDSKDVLQRVPVHRSTLNAMISDGRFPAPLRLMPSKLLWRQSVIEAWLDQREKHPVGRREFRNLPQRSIGPGINATARLPVKRSRNAKPGPNP
jgi:prophage regulatory protein